MCVCVWGGARHPFFFGVPETQIAHAKSNTSFTSFLFSASALCSTHKMAPKFKNGDRVKLKDDKSILYDYLGTVKKSKKSARDDVFFYNVLFRGEGGRTQTVDGIKEENLDAAEATDEDAEEAAAATPPEPTEEEQAELARKELLEEYSFSLLKDIQEESFKGSDGVFTFPDDNSFLVTDAKQKCSDMTTADLHLLLNANGVANSNCKSKACLISVAIDVSVHGGFPPCPDCGNKRRSYRHKSGNEVGTGKSLVICSGNFFKDGNVEARCNNMEEVEKDKRLDCVDLEQARQKIATEKAQAEAKKKEEIEAAIQALSTDEEVKKVENSLNENPEDQGKFMTAVNFCYAKVKAEAKCQPKNFRDFVLSTIGYAIALPANKKDGKIDVLLVLGYIYSRWWRQEDMMEDSSPCKCEENVEIREALCALLEKAEAAKVDKKNLKTVKELIKIIETADKSFAGKESPDAINKMGIKNIGPKRAEYIHSFYTNNKKFGFGQWEDDLNTPAAGENNNNNNNNNNNENNENNNNNNENNENNIDEIA